VKAKIDEMTYGYDDKKQYFVDKLAMGVAHIAAAFYPKTLSSGSRTSKRTSMQTYLAAKNTNLPKTTR